MKTTARESWLIASLYGINGQAIIIEDWSKAKNYLLPTIRVIGPQGGEKYRFAAITPELVRFAKNILEWDARNSRNTNGVTEENDAPANDSA